MEIIFIGIAAILGFLLLLRVIGWLLFFFEEYILPLLIWAGLGSFAFWLIMFIFGVKEILGCSTMITGAVIGLILGIWIIYFSDSDHGGGWNNDDYSGNGGTTLDDIYNKLDNLK